MKPKAQQITKKKLDICLKLLPLASIRAVQDVTKLKRRFLEELREELIASGQLAEVSNFRQLTDEQVKEILKTGNLTSVGTLTAEETDLLIKMLPITKVSTIIRFLKKTESVILTVKEALERSGRIAPVTDEKGVKTRVYTELHLEQVQKTGKLDTILRTFCVKRHGEPWTPVDDDFLRMNLGEKPLFEIAYLQGRTVKAIRERIFELDLDYRHESGYYTIRDLVELLDIEQWKLYTHVYNGDLQKLEQSGYQKFSFRVPVRRLKFKLVDPEKVRRLPVKKISTIVKATRFGALMFEEAAVKAFVRKCYPKNTLKCFFCSEKVKGSILCPACEEIQVGE